MDKKVRDILLAPFPPSEIKLKIQAMVRGKDDTAVIVAYIDARNVMDRLDEAGVDWSDSYTVVNVGGKSAVQCNLMVDGQVRSDVGDPESDGLDNSLKTAYSDAFKRAAVKFGIGRFLYSLPRMYAKVSGKYIDKSELPRLEKMLHDALAGKQVVDDSVKTEVKERVWSLDQMEAGVKAGAGLDHEEVAGVLNMSIMPDTAPVSTVESWLKHFMKNPGSDIERAQKANEAFSKAVKKSEAK